MLMSTHLLLGLVLGNLVKHPFAVMLGAVLIDFDHLFAYYMSNRKTSLKDLFQLNLLPDEEISLRSFFHTILGWIGTTAILMVINYDFGLYFSIGYVSHLFLDAIDGSNLYLFYPLHINVRGPITYNSYAEYLLNICLLILLFVI